MRSLMEIHLTKSTSAIKQKQPAEMSRDTNDGTFKVSQLRMQVPQSCLVLSSGSKNFSICSSSDFEHLILRGGGACLRNAPKPSDVYIEPVCGNNIVDTNEECDCGTPKVGVLSSDIHLAYSAFISPLSPSLACCSNITVALSAHHSRLNGSKEWRKGEPRPGLPITPIKMKVSTALSYVLYLLSFFSNWAGVDKK